MLNEVKIRKEQRKLIGKKDGSSFLVFWVSVVFILSGSFKYPCTEIKTQRVEKINVT